MLAIVADGVIEERGDHLVVPCGVAFVVEADENTGYKGCETPAGAYGRAGK